MARNELVFLENTHFIFQTNFSGDPARDSYGNSSRKANIIIPSEEVAQHMAEVGCNVKQTKPRAGEEEGYVPEYYVACIVNFDSEVAKANPPKIYLVTGNKPSDPLTPETISVLDHAYVTNVNATLEISYNKRYDKWVCYVKTMYVFQDVDDDPWAAQFQQQGHTDEGLPFPMED